jgi:outer membrane receptor for ferrienterochelin and colicins
MYVGVENLTNYRQPDPIQNAATPFSSGFDAAMVWGPIYGRLTYAGLRYRIE